MAIFKVITAPDGSGIGHATPDKLEDYLRYRKDEQGRKVERTSAVTAINEEAEGFSQGCDMLAARFNTCNTYDSLKYKHYVQGFPPEDNDKMTKERCHELGVEAAKALWPDFPVLVVSHYDQVADGTDQCHWHNHFIVYNCAVTDGHKIRTTGQELWAQKRFVAEQAEKNGLTRKGLILENGRIRESQREVPYKEQKPWQKAQKADEKNKPTETQKAGLRLAILAACDACDNYEDFCRYLSEKHHILTKESRGSIAFLHPERRGIMNRAWIRGKTLGENYTKEAIEYELTHHTRRVDRSERPESESEKVARIWRTYHAIYGRGDTPCFAGPPCKAKPHGTAGPHGTDGPNNAGHTATGAGAGTRPTAGATARTDGTPARPVDLREGPEGVAIDHPATASGDRGPRPPAGQAPEGSHSQNPRQGGGGGPKL